MYSIGPAYHKVKSTFSKFFCIFEILKGDNFYYVDFTKSFTVLVFQVK